MLLLLDYPEISCLIHKLLFDLNRLTPIDLMFQLYQCYLVLSIHIQYLIQCRYLPQLINHHKLLFDQNYLRNYLLSIQNHPHVTLLSHYPDSAQDISITSHKQYHHPGYENKQLLVAIDHLEY